MRLDSEIWIRTLYVVRTPDGIRSGWSWIHFVYFAAERGLELEEYDVTFRGADWISSSINKKGRPRV